MLFPVFVFPYGEDDTPYFEVDGTWYFLADWDGKDDSLDPLWEESWGNGWYSEIAEADGDPFVGGWGCSCCWDGICRFDD